MIGKITKGIAGFYYVYCEDGYLYECKAKGVFRKDGIKPLVGDNVCISVLDAEKSATALHTTVESSSSLIFPSTSPSATRNSFAELYRSARGMIALRTTRPNSL